jgi:hypothetical protein
MNFRRLRLWLLWWISSRPLPAPWQIISVPTVHLSWVVKLTAMGITTPRLKMQVWNAVGCAGRAYLLTSFDS